MLILIDRASESELLRVYDHVNELDGKLVLDLSDLESYTPEGSFHIVDIITEPEKLSRWKQLYLATLGARIWSDALDENSPLWAGPVPDEEKTRKISVDAAFAEGRASYFAEYGVNYIGRTNLDPRNIFVLDNKAKNKLHDPSKDAVLEALYASLPEDWWGSCAFVSTGNVDKLEAFFASQPNVIPITFTSGGIAKLKFFGLDYVWVGVPDGTDQYGIEVRNKSNRLSYELATADYPQPEIETGFKYNI